MSQNLGVKTLNFGCCRFWCFMALSGFFVLMFCSLTQSPFHVKLSEGLHSPLGGRWWNLYSFLPAENIPRGQFWHCKHWMEWVMVSGVSQLADRRVWGTGECSWKWIGCIFASQSTSGRTMSVPPPPRSIKNCPFKNVICFECSSQWIQTPELHQPLCWAMLRIFSNSKFSLAVVCCVQWNTMWSETAP